MRQKALHTTCGCLWQRLQQRGKAPLYVGLNSGHIGRRLYTRHGKRYYKPFRNFFGGKDKDLDLLVRAGYMVFDKDEFYHFNRNGLDWLEDQLGIYIYDEEN